LRSILVPRDDPDDLEQGIRAELFSGWFSNIAIAPSDPASIANSISSVLFSGALQRETSAEATSDEVRPDAFFALPRRVALTVLGKR
jgi:hypothetical protein